MKCNFIFSKEIYLDIDLFICFPTNSLRHGRPLPRSATILNKPSRVSKMDHSFLQEDSDLEGSP